jgi:hypothetical protein
MNLFLYRFFLNRTGQLSFLPDSKGGDSRSNLLQDVFVKSYHFRQGRAELGYVCERNEDDVVFAKFGRRTTQEVIHAPENHFKREVEETWPHANVFIRLDSDPNTGQVIAVEQQHRAFYKPLSSLEALANKINETLSCEGYFLSIHPVTTEQDFWGLVEKGGDNIEKVSFSFSAPNLLNLEGALTEDLKKLRAEYNATETSLSLANPIGKLKIPKTSKFVSEGVEYVRKGGGEYKLKAKGQWHRSKDMCKYNTIDVAIDLKTTDKETFITTLKELTKL